MKKVIAATSLLATLAAFGGEALADHRDEELLLVCHETDEDPHGNRGYHRVEIGRDGGRLIGSVYFDDGVREQLLKRTGVILRNAGHGYDKAYVGRELKVLFLETTGEGLLELGPTAQATRVPLICE